MFLRSIVLLAMAGLMGCSPTLPPYLLQPVDPNVRAPRMGYSSVTAGTRTFRPAEPKGWEELNRQVAPKAGNSHAN